MPFSESDGSYKDEMITCVEHGCDQQFQFSAKDKEFFDKMTFTEKPKRCRPCRAKAKARRENRG